MFPCEYYSNNTICIFSDDRQAIQEAITNLFIKEGGKKIAQLPSSPEKVIEGKYWVVGLFPGNNGWTIIKTSHDSVLCAQTADKKRPRLSALAMQLKSDAFFFSVNEGMAGLLIEANSRGEVYVSGYCGLQIVTDTFYGQPIDQPDRVGTFSLLQVPKSLKSAISINRDPKVIRMKEEYNKMYWHEDPILRDRFDEVVMKGYAQRIDESFAAVIDYSGIWGEPGLFSVKYQNSNQYTYQYSERFIKTNDCLICFEPPSNYTEPSMFEMTPEQWLSIFGELPPDLK
jgi:hypothetical protein